METLLGIAMFYSWVHGVIIICKKITDTTQYERVVLIVGLIAFVMFVIGAIYGLD